MFVYFYFYCFHSILIDISGWWKNPIRRLEIEASDVFLILPDDVGCVLRLLQSDVEVKCRANVPRAVSFLSHLGLVVSVPHQNLIRSNGA